MDFQPVFWGRRIAFFLVCVASLWLASVHGGTAAAASLGVQPSQPVSATKPAGANTTFWVVLRDKADLSGAKAQGNWLNRGQAVVQQLKNTAAASQANLRALLKGRGVDHKTFWIVNALRVTADAATMKALAARPDVERIVPDGVYTIPKPVPTTGTASVQGVEWNISRIRAPDAWASFGAQGDGITIASIDTGVQFDHPALVSTYRGNLGGGSFRHDYNWYDPSRTCGSPSLEPCDNVDHGTHTMGTMVGDDGGANKIGVAPGAKWIAVKGCETNDCSTESLLAAGEWVLAPTDLNGLNPRADLRPHIVNNSWGSASGDPFYEGIVDAWLAAGIFPAFSSGNDGPGCSSSGSPGDYAATYSSGAFDSAGAIADFSGRGPAAVDGSVKPNLAAPGVDVRSSIPGNGYTAYSGTSMASPHTAATVALMWSAAPSLVGDIAATRALLDQTAVDTADRTCGGSSSNNNVWGEGRLDAYAAVELSPRGPVGTLIGRITNSSDGSAVPGATVRAAGVTTRTSSSNGTGNYSMTLPIGAYDVTISAFGFTSRTFSAVSITEDDTTRRNAALLPAPRYQLSGYVRDAAGAPLANATVRISNTPLAPATTNATGYYSFASVPQGEYAVVVDANRCLIPDSRNVTVSGATAVDFALVQRQDSFGYSCQVEPASFIDANTVISLEGDDAATAVALPFPFTFYGQTYDTAYVATNGYLNFLEANAQFSNRALPHTDAPNGAIYAFWDDFYMDSAASVRTRVMGTAPDRRFVIEWRDVAFCCVSAERVRFEVVLYEDGRILTQYAQIDDNRMERGESATVGIENESGTVALQYASEQPVLDSGLAILYTAPPLGVVQGVVRDGIDSKGLVGATVRALQNGNVVGETTTAEGGRYRLMLGAGAYTVEASAINYMRQRTNVELRENATLIRNFGLKSARAAVTPSSLSATAVAGRVLTKTVQLTNAGRANLTYSLVELPVVLAAKTQVNPSAPGVTANKAPAGYKPVAVSAAFTGADALVLMDALPWESDALQRLLQANGIAFDMATSREMGSIDLSRYKTVFIASDQPLGFYVNYGIHRGRFSEYVNKGGLLWMGAAAGGWNGGDIDGEQLPGGVTVRGPVSEAENTIADATHPTMQGMASSYSGSPASLSVFANLPKGAKVITRGGSSGLPTSVEYSYGSGRVLAFGQTLEYGVLVGEPVGRILENAVPYAYTFDPAKDIAWMAASPLTGTLAPGATQSIRVSVDTRGLKPGLYRARFALRTNDPTKPRLLVPITLVVPAYEKAVDAGGSGYVDRNNFRWIGDRRYSAGAWGYVNNSTAQSTTHAIDGTLDDPLYQNLRQGILEYRFDNVPRGVYEIDLRFAEIANQQANRRVFHVLVEGQVQIFGHDLALEKGSFVADNHTVFAAVNDGQLNVRFLPEATSQPAIINALRVTHRPDR